MNIELSGISKRGKQIVKQHGERWRVLDKKDRVLFSDKSGPWLLVIPANLHETQTEASRWIHSMFDENFKVMP